MCSKSFVSATTNYCKERCSQARSKVFYSKRPNAIVLFNHYAFYLSVFFLLYFPKLKNPAATVEDDPCHENDRAQWIDTSRGDAEVVVVPTTDVGDDEAVSSRFGGALLPIVVEAPCLLDGLFLDDS